MQLPLQPKGLKTAVSEAPVDITVNSPEPEGIVQSTASLEPVLATDVALEAEKQCLSGCLGTVMREYTQPC